MVGAIASNSVSSVGAFQECSSDGKELASQVKEQISQFVSQFPKASVSISPAFLRKMESDPEIAAKGQEILGGLAAAQGWFEDKVKQNGMELVSSGVSVDADGNVSSWSFTRSTSDANGFDESSDKEDGLFISKRYKGAKRDSALASIQDMFSSLFSAGKSAQSATLNSADSANKISIVA